MKLPRDRSKHNDTDVMTPLIELRETKITAFDLVLPETTADGESAKAEAADEAAPQEE